MTTKLDFIDVPGTDTLNGNKHRSGGVPHGCPRKYMTTQRDRAAADPEMVVAGKGTRQRDSRRVVRSIGLGLITGAADDDPSAIGTYAAAGAKLASVGLVVTWFV